MGALRAAGIGAWGERSLSHLFQLRSCRHLLREQRRLDAVEEPFQPSHQLCLRDAQFRVGGDLIADEWQGLGLAGNLMRILMATAHERGYRVMEGFVLSENKAMRRLAVRLGFDDTAMPGDWSVRVVRLDLSRLTS